LKINYSFCKREQEKRTDPGTSFIASDASHAPNGVSVSNANADTLNALATFLKTLMGMIRERFRVIAIKHKVRN